MIRLAQIGIIVMCMGMSLPPAEQISVQKVQRVCQGKCPNTGEDLACMRLHPWNDIPTHSITDLPNYGTALMPVQRVGQIMLEAKWPICSLGQWKAEFANVYSKSCVCKLTVHSSIGQTHLKWSSDRLEERLGDCQAF